MFRRKPSRFRRTFRRRTPLARVRRTWIESAVFDPCSPLVIPILQNLDGCVTTRWEQVVVNNQVLQDQFSDRARVKRVLGNMQVLFNPNLPAATSADEIYGRLTEAFGSLFVQLIVRPIDAAGQTELPPDIWNTSSQLSGYSEAKAKKTWWHHWWSNDAFSTSAGQTNFAGAFQTFGLAHRLHLCGTDTTACITPDSLADGSGFTWETQTGHDDGVQLDAECVACGEVDLAAAQVISHNNDGFLRAPRVWNFAFDVRKSISLREDEQLVLDFQARVPQNTYQDFSFQVLSGGIKTLLQF